MSKKLTARGIPSSGPLTYLNDNSVWQIEGNQLRHYNDAYDLPRIWNMIKVAVVLFPALFVAFLAYTEFRYRFTPDSFWNASFTGALVQEIFRR